MSFVFINRLCVHQELYVLIKNETTNKVTAQNTNTIVKRIVESRCLNTIVKRIVESRRSFVHCIIRIPVNTYYNKLPVILK